MTNEVNNVTATFFKKKDKTSSKVVYVQFNHDQQSNQDQQSSSCSTDLQSTTPLTYQDGGKINFEIRWCLKQLITGYIDSSVTDSCHMFELGRNKLKCNTL